MIIYSIFWWIGILILITDIIYVVALEKNIKVHVFRKKYQQILSCTFWSLFLYKKIERYCAFIRSDKNYMQINTIYCQIIFHNLRLCKLIPVYYFFFNRTHSISVQLKIHKIIWNQYLYQKLQFRSHCIMCQVILFRIKCKNFVKFL